MYHSLSTNIQGIYRSAHSTLGCMLRRHDDFPCPLLHVSDLCGSDDSENHRVDVNGPIHSCRRLRNVFLLQRNSTKPEQGSARILSQAPLFQMHSNCCHASLSRVINSLSYHPSGPGVVLFMVRACSISLLASDTWQKGSMVGTESTCPQSFSEILL